MQNVWLSVLLPIITIAVAIWTKKIIPSLLNGLLLGGYLLNPTLTGGFETAVDQIVKTLTDVGSLEVHLFLYLFSGLISLIKKSGGIKAFSDITDKHIKSERGVLLLLWALIPFTFIDCGFRVVGAGSITRSLVEKNKIAKERLAFMQKDSVAEIADATLNCLLRVVPAAVPGIAFLSGRQSAELASARLNAMHLRFKSQLPWALTFSFARAIQQPALEIWQGKEINMVLAQGALYHRAKCNVFANVGEYNVAMEIASTK